MKNKAFYVSEIQKTLGLSNFFQRIDMNYPELETIEHLLTLFLEDCQNNSPELKTMIQLCKDYSGIMECYIVETYRHNTRFSCEGIVFPRLSDTQLCELANTYHIADEFCITVNKDGTFRLRLWWD